MKKIVATSLIVMLYCITTLSFAQKDSLSRKPTAAFSQLETDLKKFDLEEDLRLMTLLTTALEKEGLIDRKDAYKLEVKDGAFYINDKKQPSEVTEKYRKYFRKDKTDNYTIINNGDGLATASADDDIPAGKPGTGSVHSDRQGTWFDAVQYQKDLQLMTSLIKELEKDGLLVSNKPYKLEVKKGELFINDKKQPKEIADKYRKYFQSNNYALIND